MEDKQVRLKRETEVAIAILVACARSNDCRLKTADAAKAAETTSDFAAHVALKLVNAGLLTATRGRNGGLELSRSASAISLHDVICPMEDQNPVASNAGNSRGEYLKAKALIEVMRGVDDAVQTYLNRFSIHDLAEAELPLEEGKIEENSETMRAKRRARRSSGLESRFV
ncbi:RrF2 family transcriptional regulator [Aliirhizobium smilacinae]|uniref:RrF2 family transcriptional regulator n=1 Tax=Aliirhizobium smilacinae TaxID=1395944 RepID=UPI0015D574C3|nr:Rrf2 family transcriptional regulator [Rhizobium smilacinae]